MSDMFEQCRALIETMMSGRGPSTDSDARQVLDVRYARRQLDRETYVRMRADLTDHAPAAR